MKRFGILIVALLVALVLASAVGAQDAPKLVCQMGTARAPLYVKSFALGSYTPCGWKVVLEGAGRVWAIEGSSRIPLTVSPYFGHQGCKMRPVGKLKPQRDGYVVAARVKVVSAECALWVNLVSETAPSQWGMYLWDIKANARP